MFKLSLLSFRLGHIISCKVRNKFLVCKSSCMKRRKVVRSCTISVVQILVSSIEPIGGGSASPTSFPSLSEPDLGGFRQITETRTYMYFD